MEAEEVAMLYRCDGRNSKSVLGMHRTNAIDVVILEVVQTGRLLTEGTMNEILSVLRRWVFRAFALKVFQYQVERRIQRNPKRIIRLLGEHWVEVEHSGF